MELRGFKAPRLPNYRADKMHTVAGFTLVTTSSVDSATGPVKPIGTATLHLLEEFADLSRADTQTKAI